MILKGTQVYTNLPDELCHHCLWWWALYHIFCWVLVIIHQFRLFFSQDWSALKGDNDLLLFNM